MVLSLALLKVFVPILVSNRFMNILVIALYSIIGALVYFLVMIKLGTVKRIFGEEILSKFKRKAAHTK